MKPAQINVYDAKVHLSRWLDEVHAGKRIVIAKNGRPYALLVPYEKEQKTRPLGFVKAKLTTAFFDPLPEEELRAWEGLPPKKRKKK